jgi:hypothetical protein
VDVCGEFVPSPKDGTYFATNESGTWTSERLSPDWGATAIAIDPQTDRIHGLLASDTSLTYYTRSPAGHWSHMDLGPGFAFSPVIRQDPTTSALLVVYISEYRVCVLTKP